MTEPERKPRCPVKRSRCAIYTRKSTDEGLDQAFNSLDAQRESCAAFILSQKHEGWTVLATQYDEGGYSGGTIERPALKRLLADIEAGQIDVVVVYKVDRLTRALSDFAKLVEIFDRRGVSFVSITQQFNTTTSMGRLTLNVLLSFAQFEREVIGERVRDKIAASKKKGMWMGGMPPLGYDVRDRRLVVNDNEARIVVDIYRRYLALESVRDLQVELAGLGIRSKQRVRPDDTTYGGQKLARGALYLMLQNRIYRGEITHKGMSYPAEHPAIIDQPLWDEVQAVLAKNRVERVTGARAKRPSLLGGFVFDARGERLTPTYAIKKGTRYRYYISASLMRDARRSRSGGWRIPAGDLEGLVINRLRNFLTDPTALLDAMNAEVHPGTGQRQLIERGRQIAEELGAETPDKVKATLMALLCQVKIYTDRIEIGISRDRTAGLLADQSIDLTAQDQKSDRSSDDIMALRVPARLKRVGREMRMLVQSVDHDQAAADPSLLRIIARAHDIQARLGRNTELTVHDVAREEHVTAAYIYTLLRLPWLAPDITTAIVNGRQPQQFQCQDVNAQRLAAAGGLDRATDSARTLKIPSRNSDHPCTKVRIETLCCSPHCSKKSKPPNGPGEIFEVAWAEIPGALRFCRTSQWEVIKTSQMDEDEQLGQPVVPNGIPLSKIHPAAFDASSDAELDKVASEGIALIRSGVHLEPRRLWGSDRRIGSLTLHQDTEGPHVLSSDFAVHAEPEELRDLSRQG